MFHRRFRRYINAVVVVVVAYVESMVDRCDGRTCTVVTTGDPDTYRCAVHGLHACGAHRCTARYVGTDAQVCCRITGRTFHAMMASHPYQAVEHGTDVADTTCCPVAAVRRPTVRRPVRSPFVPSKRAACHSIAKTMVFELLFGPRRLAWCRALQRAATDRARRALHRFERQWRRRPSVDEATRLVHDALASGPVIPTAPMDRDAWTNVHVRLVMDVWDAMGQTPYAQAHAAHIRFLDCALGCTYLLPQGLAFDGHCFVPHKPSVGSWLPPAAVVDRLGFRVKDVTVGKNHIVKAFRSSVRPSTTERPRTDGRP